MNPSVSKANVSEELLISQITDEFMERLDRGERPDVEQYARQHPELASVLRQVLPALQMVRDSSANNDQAQTLEADVPQEPLGDFHIIREIGRGGMGVVYEADQLSLGRKVALKVLPFAATMDPRQLQRFKNEAMAAASLDHPNMVDVYGVGCERGVHYYAMRLIDGHTLAEVISQLQQLHHTGGAIPDSVSGVFSSEPGEPEQEVRSSTPNELTEDYKGPTGDIPAEKKETQAEIQAGVATKKSRFNPAYFRSIADLGLQVAEALDHAHHEGIIHRDIKPSNLMLDSRGKIWITDFGLAHVETGGSLTLTGDLVGTVRYMSPEQAFAKRVPLDHRTDVYSLGVTLYELLTLQPAFGGNDRQELLRQIAFEEPSPPRKLNSSVPADLETIVLKAMEKNPGDRYATAEELADDLRRYLDDQPIKARRASVPQRIGKWVRRHQALVGSAAAVLLISCLILGTSIGWLVRGEEIRREVAAGKASQARDRVHQLAEAGRWNEARAVALHADSILAGGGNAALRKMVQEQVGDLTLLVEIDKLSLKKTERYNEVGNWDLKAFAREYTKHFAQWGITPGKTPHRAHL